ncbi:hypothetical protein E2C01_061244 [Portunus trituberculatus]|uniref:Uncharacterized protein n=1 Tax=Portunus trituberculatus TaxID=210409 RepID=A0A5B7HB51_PORTR|nr:hypothetical protein [Portunus trituberculatus]
MHTSPPPLPPRVSAGKGGASIRSIMEEAHCHQHPIPPLHSSSSSARPPPSNHAPSRPSTLNTPAHPTLHPPPTVDTTAAVFQVEQRLSTPPSECRTPSRTVASVVMHVTAGRAALGDQLLTFATSSMCVHAAATPRGHPEAVFLVLGGGALLSRLPQHPRSATFWQKFGWRGSVRLGVRVRWSRPADRPRAHPHFFTIFTPTRPALAPHATPVATGSVCRPAALHKSLFASRSAV